MAIQVTTQVATKPKLLIDGDWVEAASGRTFQTVDPATEEVLADVAHGGAETSIVPWRRRAAPSSTTRRGGG